MGKFNTLCCVAASCVNKFSQLISYRWQVTKTLRPNVRLFLTKISFKCGQFCGWATKNYSRNTTERIRNTPFTISVHFSVNLMKMDGRLHLQSISLVLLFRGTSLSARLMFSWSLWILMRYRQQRRDDSMCWISDAFLFPRCGHYSPPRRWLLKPQQMQKRLTPRHCVSYISKIHIMNDYVHRMDLSARSSSLFCSFLCAFWVLCVSVNVERKSF